MSKTSRATKRDTEFTKDQKQIGDYKIDQYAASVKGRLFIGCKPRRSTPMDCLAGEIVANTRRPDGMACHVYRQLIRQRLENRRFEGALAIIEFDSGGMLAQFGERKERTQSEAIGRREKAAGTLNAGRRRGRRGYDRWQPRASFA